MAISGIGPSSSAAQAQQAQQAQNTQRNQQPQTDQADSASKAKNAQTQGQSQNQVQPSAQLPKPVTNALGQTTGQIVNVSA